MKNIINLSGLLKWWRSVDKYIFTSVMILIFAGIFFIFSATPVVAKRIGLDKFFFVWRHLLYTVPTLIFMLLISMLEVKHIRRLAVILFFLSVVGMICTVFVGEEIKGARRWLNLWFVILQPSEFIKFSFIVFTAWMFSEHNIKFPGYQIAITSLSIVLLLLLLQPDLGMTFLVFSAWIVQFFLIKLSVILIISLFILWCLAMCVFYYIFPHFASRIDKFLGISENYQVQKSLESLLNGGFWGVGPGEGSVKRYLPDAHSDFIFSVIAEEFGGLVCILIVMIFAVIILRALYLSKNQNDNFVKLSIVGTVFMFGTQVVINIASAISLIPTKGMTLPFISYGGSSSISMGIFTGILLGLTKKSINYNKYY